MELDWAVSVLISFVLPFFYVFVVLGKQGKDGFASEDTRRMYFAAVQSLLTAAGVAVAITGALRGLATHPEPMLARATVSLSFCVFFALLSLLEMARLYEKTRITGSKKQPVVIDPLTTGQLIWVLVLDYIALATFFWGLSYFVRAML